MSISDLIVVMKDGVVQQIGKPQEVYDDPANLFVAKFLGTPPIGVFDGRIEGGALYIGDDKVLDGIDHGDCPVTVGIRPEGYIPAEGGFTCRLGGIEIMGRDKSVVFSHPAAESAHVRAIIGSDVKLNIDGDKISFALKREKVHVFDKESGCRILLSEKGEH